MVRFLATGIFLFFSLALIAQGGYFLNEKRMSVNEKIIDNGEILNAQLCQVQKGKRVVEFSPKELVEYGFKDGRIYSSKEIELNGISKQVFLERIAEDPVKAYYYREKGLRTFFIENEDGSLKQVPRKDELSGIGYKEDLSAITADCPDIDEAIYLANYSKGSISELFRRYRSCESAPFPFLKVGVSAGYSLVQLRPNRSLVLDYYNYLDLNPVGSISVGFFVDSPVDYGNFSFHTGMYFSRHEFQAGGAYDGDYFTFSADISSLVFPVQIKYAFPLPRHRPYLKAGGIWVNNFRSEDNLNLRSFEYAGIDLNFQGYIYRNLMGVSLGAGIDFKLSRRNYLFLEIGYSRMGGVFESASPSLNSSELRISSGISF